MFELALDNSLRASLRRATPSSSSWLRQALEIGVWFSGEIHRGNNRSMGSVKAQSSGSKHGKGIPNLLHINKANSKIQVVQLSSPKMGQFSLGPSLGLTPMFDTKMTLSEDEDPVANVEGLK
ncbi:hypothetical protein V6N12_010328 [Hibiscus sabdariffa]|uniref:Uncharacterized protein n=1 Tax=Hibiscus sabdariffa TaxID=183260 RepID=A0ABR2EJS0_9ROSI